MTADRAVAAGLAVLGVIQTLTGIVMLADPGLFYEEVASFAPENAHLFRDVGTFQLAFGLALLWSVRRPSWRLPLIAFGFVQFTLHAINHLADIDETVVPSHGEANFAAITLGALTLALLLYAERRRLRR